MPVTETRGKVIKFPSHRKDSRTASEIREGVSKFPFPFDDFVPKLRWVAFDYLGWEDENLVDYANELLGHKAGSPDYVDSPEDYLIVCAIREAARITQQEDNRTRWDYAIEMMAESWLAWKQANDGPETRWGPKAEAAGKLQGLNEAD